MQKYAFGLYTLALALLLIAMPVLIAGAAGNNIAAFLGLAVFGASLAIALLIRDTK